MRGGGRVSCASFSSSFVDAPRGDTEMKSTALTVLVGMLLTIGTGHTLLWGSETMRSFERCEIILKETEQEDLATVVDERNSRLHTTWLSQECEVFAGPEYMIRKYTFFKNSTFLLLRYHYGDMSCSMPTHTVRIRGSIKLLGPSNVVSGATEAKIHVDAVYITPLNRQVAHKFEQRMNLSCGPQPRWRPYVPQLIYEQPRQHSTAQLWQGPVYNTLQAHTPWRKRMDCLDAFRIEFAELRLLRVQRRLFLPRISNGSSYHGPRFELLLGSPTPNVSFRRIYKATSLQPTVLLDANGTSDCAICGSVFRATELSPPLLHVTAALPALIGGYWLSERCESSEGGVWSKRQFQMYSEDKLWTGRWDYYEDPHCSILLYSITAAGSYIQRNGTERRSQDRKLSDFFRLLNNSARFFFKRSATDVHRSSPNRPRGGNFISASSESKERLLTRIYTKEKKRPRKRSLTDNVDRFLLGDPSKRPVWNVPSGPTELDLHIVESILIPGDAEDTPLTGWSRDCVPRLVEAPSTLGLRAKVTVSWNSQYILLLGLRDDHVWDPPLRQCAQIPSNNPALRAHLRRSVSLRFGLSSAGPASRLSSPVWLLASQFILLYRTR
ncbi:PREDICTED: uncharacterized protein LOC106745841 [Dinoponera quadriceps]|uniref:Uncharacterized protein LOC106745841 n=1 Tax=Dinoponera quadriceps TaxID=609295 RepID=A0A6P3XFV5_DINQU|nr:PREDICTED: uncharacterized protein LOC106745841 [Dinoponera quadriceps]